MSLRALTVTAFLVLLAPLYGLGQSRKALKLVERGLRYAATGNATKAVSYYTRAIAEQPDYYSAYLNRAISYYELAEFQLAIEDYNNAERLNPQDPVLYMDRGNAFSRSGHYVEALTDHQRALELGFPASDTLLYNMANNFWRMGQMDSALIYFDKVLQINPELIEAKGNKAFVYLLQNRYAEAAGLYQELLIGLPDNASYMNNLGYAELRSGRLDSAMYHVQRSLELAPRNAYSYRNRGLIHMARNEQKLACADLRKALDLEFIKQWGSRDLEELMEYCRNGVE